MLKLYLFLFAFISISFTSNAQVKKLKKYPATIIYAGKYSYGTTAEKEEVGFAYIYSETDSTILFYLDLNAGPPSLSMGEIYGRVTIKKTKGVFESSFTNAKQSCKFSFQFFNNKLIIKTVDAGINCGFGHSVFADGTYKKISNKNPTFFIDQTASKIYFKDLNL